MASETYLNVPGMEDTSRKLASATENFSGAIDELKASLARDEGCWSDDKIGKSFENTYVGPATETQNGLTELAKSLRSFATEGMPNAVRNFQKVDSDGGDALNKLS
ncbi:hypothetical protein MOQ72_08540 [Saccharopolyspora sp. K220]|uniref:hypothetical protein n=1 Tax=Saccharopolyspora soli TaxID=2926618 RepID=UPI001F57154E|nr:hypothetical protein [Saccharopolyspora soli]MCI2417469.1 hypothetical protein [Saccharopolyspora soli]